MKQSKESHMKFLALRMQSNKCDMFSNLGVLKISIYKIMFEKRINLCAIHYASVEERT